MKLQGSKFILFASTSNFNWNRKKIIAGLGGRLGFTFGTEE
jgi:hypothetical protein